MVLRTRPASPAASPLGGGVLRQLRRRKMSHTPIIGYGMSGGASRSQLRLTADE